MAHHKLHTMRFEDPVKDLYADNLLGVPSACLDKSDSKSGNVLLR
jgi:hypothetical protein